MGLTLAVTMAALGFAACGTGTTPMSLAGTVVEPVPNVASIVLPDAAAGGEAFSTVAEPGRLLVVYFGYTSCPDICPASLADLRTALDGLGAGAGLIDVAMVSVDPMRDTPDVLTSYIQSFVPESHALRTDDPQLLVAVAEAFGAGFTVSEYEDGSFSVGHTAFLYAVDESGDIVVQWDFGTSVEVIEDDLAQLVEHRT